MQCCLTILDNVHFQLGFHIAHAAQISHIVRLVTNDYFQDVLFFSLTLLFPLHDVENMAYFDIQNFSSSVLL